VPKDGANQHLLLLLALVIGGGIAALAAAGVSGAPAGTVAEESGRRKQDRRRRAERWCAPTAGRRWRRTPASVPAAGDGCLSRELGLRRV